MIRLTPWTGSGLGLALAMVLAQCTPSSAPETRDARLAPIQPNPTSALAQSMRDLDAELLEARALIEAGDAALADFRFSEVDFTTLAPTDSSMLVEGFTAFSVAFAHHVAAFNAAPGPDTYSAVVGGCEACHQKACPGPLERIAQRQLTPGLDLVQDHD